MADLSALTPPLLVCLVVVVAIVAFVRHEMGRKRPGQEPPDDTTPAVPPASDEPVEPQRRR